MANNKLVPAHGNAQLPEDYDSSNGGFANQKSQKLEQVQNIVNTADRVVQSASQMLQTEAAVNVSVALREVALGYKSYKDHLAKLEELDKHSEDMKTKFERMQPELQKCNDRLDQFYNDLKALQGREMTEKEEQQYNGLLSLVRKQMDDLVHMYDSIMQ